MNAAEIRTDTPTVEARYLVFVPCEGSANAWCCPAIATWHGGKWHVFDQRPPMRPVLGWIGPIPVLKTVDLEPKVFDL